MAPFEVASPGVLKLLSNLDTKKSTGPDELSPIILKDIKNEIMLILTFIFNQSSVLIIWWSSQWLVECQYCWSAQKKTKEFTRQLSANFPEQRMLQTSWTYHIFQHLPFPGRSPRQHGFQTRHSCETQLILTFDDWAKSLSLRTETDTAIFDLTKAFDTVISGNCTN